jgi:hypothetical protein
VSGAGGPLPHLDAIQASFGRYDVSGVRAHTDGAAAQAAANIGAAAYATGSDVAFANAPSLHTAAHEAAHTVQQQAGVQLQGGVGQVEDRYERHADAVADAVVQGKFAEGLLDQLAAGPAATGPGVQRRAVQCEEAAAQDKPPGLDRATLEPAQLAEAVRFNQGVKRKASPEQWEGIETALFWRPEDGQSTDEAIALHLAQLQNGLHLPPDGKLTPFTLRQLSSLFVAAAGMADEAISANPKAYKAMMDGVPQWLRDRGTAVEDLATGKAGAKPRERAKNFDPSTLYDVRATVSPDLAARGEVAAKEWRDRAYVIKNSSGDVAGKLSEIVGLLFGRGFVSEAEEVLQLIPMLTATHLEKMRTCITSLGASATGGDVGNALKFIRMMLRLTGVSFKDSSDATTFLQTNTEAMGRCFGFLDGVLGSKFGLALANMTLKAGFANDPSYSSELDAKGGLTKLTKDASGRMKADCDVYSQYGARLLTPQGYHLIGYLVVQGNSPDVTGHSVALLKKADKTGKFQYSYVDSLENPKVGTLGVYGDDRSAAVAMASQTYDAGGATYFVPPDGNGRSPAHTYNFPPNPGTDVVKGTRPPPPSAP